MGVVPEDHPAVVALVEQILRDLPNAEAGEAMLAARKTVGDLLDAKPSMETGACVSAALMELRGTGGRS